MNPIGFLIVLGIILALVYVVIMITDKIKVRRLRKNYNEKKDKSKQGENRRRELGGLPNLTEGESSIKGSSKLKGGKLLQTTDSSTTRKDRKRTRGGRLGRRNRG